MSDQSKFTALISALSGFARVVIMLGPWFWVLTIWPRAEAQTSRLIPEVNSGKAALVPARASAPARKSMVTSKRVSKAIKVPIVAMQDPVPFIPATAAFSNSPVCSDSDLRNNSDEARANPEWKAVDGLLLNLDTLPTPLVNDAPTILEGFVPFPPNPESSDSQATSEVSEEDIPWNHFTHDFTFKVAPDLPYQHLLSSWARFPGTSFPIGNTTRDIDNCFEVDGVPNNGVCVVAPETCPDGSMSDTCHHSEMEVEWENASLMDEGEGFQRIWGAVPEFVWPAAGDRVWVAGRWIFDCGHPGVPKVAAVRQFVKYSTEIHPPRALVTMRLNHTALDSFPRPRVSAPNFPGRQSYLPVTGVPVFLGPDSPNTGPTQVAVTEADIYVTGNGGGANDLCMIIAVNEDNDCKFGHSNTVFPVNDRNYVFDIYPPVTDYSHLEPSGAFKVFPPTADASLQWRVEDHFSELPAHTCGGTNVSGCVTVEPIFCLIDATTPPPDQTETGCPAVAAGRPTRLRVILPFAGSAANFFARSILLGWDDVPFTGSINFVVRNLKVTLHKFTVLNNARTRSVPGNWRVFVNVAGQYRYISPFFDRDSDGNNKCNGDSLTSNQIGDCFQFDDTPWIVNVQNFNPIHVGVGGFDSRGVDGDFCRQFPPRGGCAPFSFGDLVGLAFENPSRIGTYEFDLFEARNYQWVRSDGTPLTSFTTDETSGEQYKVEFRVEDLPAVTPPASAPLQLGTPHFNNFVSSATPLILSSASPETQGFQYRSYLQGGPLPVYPSAEPFPVHWTHADLPAGSQSVPVFLTGADGTNLLQFSAESFANLLEPRHTETLILDNTPPVITIIQPQATAYTHTATLTLNYSVDDGTGSGVASFTPTMDGAITLSDGTSLQSGQPIRLLKQSLGTHTFRVSTSDNVNNSSSSSITFTIIVTPASILEDVQQFLQDGAIENSGIANSLLAKLSAAQDRADCSASANNYQAFINELQAQSGKGVSADAAATMIADAEYLIAHCP